MKKKTEELENNQPTPVDSALETAHKAFDILDEKKGRNLRVLRVADKTVLAEYFVLCTAISQTQISPLANELDFKMAEKGCLSLHLDGKESGEWTVVDFGDVMVHIFAANSREFYALDKLYGDCEEVHFESIDERAEKEKEKAEKKPRKSPAISKNTTTRKTKKEV